jgi:hypothetical protein
MRHPVISEAMGLVEVHEERNPRPIGRIIHLHPLMNLLQQLFRAGPGSRVDRIRKRVNYVTGMNLPVSAAPRDISTTLVAILLIVSLLASERVIFEVGLFNIFWD